MTQFALKNLTANIALLTLGLLAGPAAHAQIYNVSVDTSGLTAGNQYAVDLQLNQGASPGSTVNVTSFIFGNGGSPGAAPPAFLGTAAGSLGTAVNLDDTAQNAEFTQNFNNGAGAPPGQGGAGSTVSFQVDGSGLKSSTGTPDQFVFDLFDTTTGANVATNNSPGGIELFTLTNTGGVYSPTAYSYTNGGSTFQTTVTAAPELGTPLTFGLLLGLLGISAARARRRNPSPAR